MKKIFISSTLKTEWNREYNLALCTALEKKDVECFLPQRDINPVDNLSIAKENIQAINNSSVFLSVVFNESPNLGFEAGYAFGTNKKILLITKSDYVMPEMFYSILRNSELFEVKDLNSIELYIDELIKKINAISSKYN